MKIYHTGMWYMWIEWLCIPRRPNFLISLILYLNIIGQSTKLTFNVNYTNQVISPHNKKTGNWNGSIMLLFFQCTAYPNNWKLKWEYYVIIFSMRLTDAFYSLLSFPCLHLFLRSFLFTLIFPSTPVPLGVILDYQPYVETRASTCSPWGLVCAYPDVHHLGGKNR